MLYWLLFNINMRNISSYNCEGSDKVEMYTNKLIKCIELVKFKLLK